MSSIFQNDLVLCINKRVLRNLAISMDHAVEQGVSQAVVTLDIGAAVCPELGTLMARGLEHPVELIANAVVPVPRLLYASTNGAFSPALGADDLGSLVNHLLEFDSVAAGPVDSTLSPGDSVCGMALDVPCPIQFRRDPGKRVTFLRDVFFQDNAPDFLEVTAQGILITIQGKAHVGDHFSRDKALKDPTHQFTLKLLYKVEFIDSDVGFGRVPFQMVQDPPAPSASGMPGLPRNGSFVFASGFDDGVSGTSSFILPRLTPFDGAVDKKGCDDAAGCQPRSLSGNLFSGQADDLIFDDPTPQQTADGEMPVPRYRVESRSPSEPQKLVIRQIGDPTILAEARGGRLSLGFVKVDSLEMTPVGGAGSLGQADKSNIGKSLTKFNPVMSQSFLCALQQPPGDGQDNAKVNAAQLQLLGPRGLDLPLLPQNIAIPVEAHVVRSVDTTEITAGFPENSVKSEIISCALTKEKYFAGGSPDQQVFAVSGKIGGAGDDVFLDYSDGSDMAMATSQLFMQPILDQMGSQAMEQIKSQGLPGLDGSTLAFKAAIGDGFLSINVTGSGEVETPWPLPNVPYDFDAAIKVHMRAQRSVVVAGENAPKPLDRFGCPIPQEALDALKLDLAANRLLLPNPLAPSAVAGQNPLCFAVYWDPDDGIACFDKRLDTDGDGVGDLVVEACPQPTRLAPPVLDASGNEIPIPDPDNPPDICEDPNTTKKEQGPDDQDAFGQAAFDLPENDGLKHQFGLVALPPGEDDVKVTIDVDEGLMFLVSMLGFLMAPAILATLGLLGPVGLIATPIVATVLFTGLILLPFAGPIASVIVTFIAKDKLKDQFRQLDLAGISTGAILGIHMREPATGKDPFALESSGGLPGVKGDFVIRNHVVVQSAGINVGI